MTVKMLTSQISQSWYLQCCLVIPVQQFTICTLSSSRHAFSQNVPWRTRHTRMEQRRRLSAIAACAHAATGSARRWPAVVMIWFIAKNRLALSVSPNARLLTFSSLSLQTSRRQWVSQQTPEKKWRRRSGTSAWPSSTNTRFVSVMWKPLWQIAYMCQKSDGIHQITNETKFSLVFSFSCYVFFDCHSKNICSQNQTESL